MATDAVQRQPLTRTRHAPIHRTRERIFFAIMTILMVATILLGFRASYFPLGERPAALANPAIIAHATVFTLFLLLFAVQTTLVAAHRVRWHMKLGLWLYGIAALMFPLGLLAAIDELRRDVAINRYPIPGHRWPHLFHHLRHGHLLFRAPDGVVLPPAPPSRRAQAPRPLRRPRHDERRHRPLALASLGYQRELVLVGLHRPSPSTCRLRPHQPAPHPLGNRLLRALHLDSVPVPVLNRPHPQPGTPSPTYR